MKKYKRKGLVQGQARNPDSSKAEGRARGTDARPAYYLAYACEKCPLACHLVAKSRTNKWLFILNQTCPLLPREANWQRLARKTDNAVAILKKRYSRKENTNVKKSR